MPYTEDAQALIAAIKAKVHLLELDEDWMAMDKACGEIDTLLYKLRQIVLQPVRGRKAVRATDWLKELEKEMDL